MTISISAAAAALIATFFGRDAEGLQHTSTFGEDDLVSRYAKISRSPKTPTAAGDAAQ